MRELPNVICGVFILYLYNIDEHVIYCAFYYNLLVLVEDGYMGNFPYTLQALST